MNELAGFYRMMFVVLALCVAVPHSNRAAAQPPPAPAKPEMMENCPGLVASERPRVIPAGLELAALGGDQVRI
jgi:hypothetical protein